MNADLCFHKHCGGRVTLTGEMFRCVKCDRGVPVDETTYEPPTHPPSNEPLTLYVVGQRRNGSYETFELQSLEGDGIDDASDACLRRGLRYIHCSRPLPRK